ncbi:hypothetical protein [Antribacter gilvus]|uniref:hypothetical protein n=1 Tax=Antribacter gilvus TaxID=2304675 RepID=UPI000F7B6DDB|nr:hypothetical protein [Antribacter gilvus]
MPKIKNVSRFGALDVPLLGRIVDADEVIEVTDEQASRLLDQADNWRPFHPTDENDPLRGQALDEALKAAGLPITGSADEKRQRLVDARR